MSLKIPNQPIIQCTLTGEFVKVHESLSLAEIRTKVPRAEIAKVLKMKIPFDRFGNTWLYFTEETKHLVTTKENT